MNKNTIKEYAIWSRRELIDRVSQKAFEYGIEKDQIEDVRGDTVKGVVLSQREKSSRLKLVSEIKTKGFDQVMEEVAYTWFNRFIALRFMEVNNYLPQRVRPFTDEDNKFNPQIIDEASDLDFVDKNEVYSYKINNDTEGLYKYLLIALCNDMNKYLPGMFETIDDYKVLLFPDNLLREGSVVSRLISGIDEDSWTDQVQIIGWLYQFYNTEPKDRVYARKSGTKIKKEEIPAVTQLFTPDWIVRYMTENSLGRLWLDGHPKVDIKNNWKYYLDEAEQESEVEKQLEEIRLEHSHLTPEDIKFIDPCMGSGHILVYAFDVLMQIYVSEGWTERDAVKSILKNNIYGLDIDDRAYQLSYFALMMKARQYSRRILNDRIMPNIMAIEETNTFNKELLRYFGELKPLAEKAIDIFYDAKEYGSILNVHFTQQELESLENKLEDITKMSSYGNLLTQMESDQLVEDFYPFLKQARIMSQKYDVLVTNTLEDNLQYIADALGGKGTPREIIRNYFVNDFFKDHCDTYQVTGSGKRPIYWQFDSGKKNGFKALIYMHRYTPDLLAKMRTDYVHEQQERYRTQIENLEAEIINMNGTEKIKANKLLAKYKDQLTEISVFEEKLHHLADQMISIDLDDGFKQNYPKFEGVVTKVK